MPRITTGQAGGIKLKTAKNNKTRPTSDRVKQALFSILGDSILRGPFLDLYAGCGQIGLEALSRGCPEVIMAEKNQRAAAIIRENISKSKLQPQLYIGTAIQLVNKCIEDQKLFEVVFLDPPWHIWPKEAELLRPLLPQILKNPGGIVVVEHPTNETIDLSPLQVIKNYKYGETTMSLWHSK